MRTREKKGTKRKSRRSRVYPPPSSPGLPVPLLWGKPIQQRPSRVPSAKVTSIHPTKLSIRREEKTLDWIGSSGTWQQHTPPLRCTLSDVRALIELSLFFFSSFACLSLLLALLHSPPPSIIRAIHTRPGQLKSVLCAAYTRALYLSTTSHIPIPSHLSSPTAPPPLPALPCSAYPALLCQSPYCHTW